MTIEKYLRDNGPGLSGALIEVMSKEGITKEAIRKRLSRLTTPIMKLRGFFKDNQTFFYLQEQYQSEEYFLGLREAFREAAKRYYSILVSIEFHNGFIRKDQLAAYTFSPVKNLSSHKNFRNVIDDLISLKIVYEDGEYYRLNNTISLRATENFRYYKGLELAKDILLHQFHNYSRNIGLVSYDSVTYHSEFSKLQWCFVGPSYVAGIVKRNDNKLIPSFVLADLLIGRSVNKDEVSFFVEKINIIRTQTASNFLPFLLVENLSHDALLFLKQNGVIIGFVDKLFGAEYGELLKMLINTVTNAGAVLKSNPDAYLKLIEQLNKLVEGKVNNLRGDLFELAVGYYYSNLCQSLDIGRKINFDGETKEIDVLVNFQTEIRIAECKAYKSKVNKESIESWLSKKIPVIYKWTKEFSNEKQIIFEFWSTSGFSDEALALLKESKVKIKKYTIEFYGETEILEKARKSNAHKIVEIMRNYFINNP